MRGRVRILVALLVALVLLGAPTPAGAGCDGPGEPGESCDDTVPAQGSANSWVLIPLGLSIGLVAAGTVVAFQRRRSGPV